MKALKKIPNRQSSTPVMSQLFHGDPYFSPLGRIGGVVFVGFMGSGGEIVTGHWNIESLFHQWASGW